MRVATFYELTGILLLVCFSGIAGAQTTIGNVPNDGNWWRGLPEFAKLAYVAGYLDGECGGARETITENNLTNEQIKSKVAVCVWPPDVTLRQTVESVDQFYYASKNRGVLTGLALLCVKTTFQLGQEIKEANKSDADIDRLEQEFKEAQKIGANTDKLSHQLSELLNRALQISPQNMCQLIHYASKTASGETP